MSEQTSRTLHLIHISDSHIASAAPHANLHRLEVMVDEIARLIAGGVPVDAVVHTGDLMDDADEPEAPIDGTRRAAAVLARLERPLHLVNGNHDRRAFLRESFPTACVPCGTDALLPSCRYGRFRLVFLDANPEDGEHDLGGLIHQRQLHALEQLLEKDAAEQNPACVRTALFLHYPPLEQQSHWTGRPAGGEALCELLARHADRVAGVFTGHVHRSIHQLRGGVLFSTAPSLSRSFLLWPGQLEHDSTVDPSVPWHYVTLERQTTHIQHHTVGSDRGK